MNRSELITIVANRLKMDEKVVFRAILVLINQITDELSVHKRVEVRGFGRWIINGYKNKRLFNNLRNGGKFIGILKPKARFKAGKELADRVNKTL